MALKPRIPKLSLTNLASCYNLDVIRSLWWKTDYEPRVVVCTGEHEGQTGIRFKNYFPESAVEVRLSHGRNKKENSRIWT